MLRNIESYVKSIQLSKLNSRIDLCATAIKSLKKQLKKMKDIDRDDFYKTIANDGKDITYATILKNELLGKETKKYPKYFSSSVYLDTKNGISEISKVHFENMYLLVYLKHKKRFTCIRLSNVEKFTYDTDLHTESFNVVGFDEIEQKEISINTDYFAENIVFNIEKTPMDELINVIKTRSQFEHNFFEAMKTVQFIYDMNLLKKSYELSKNMLIENFKIVSKG